MASRPLLARVLHAETARIARCPFTKKNRGENNKTEKPTRGESVTADRENRAGGMSDDATRARTLNPVLHGAFQHELDARDFRQ